MDIPLPQYIQLHPTLRCNQRCRFCFNPPCNNVSDMSFDGALTLLEVLLSSGIGEIDIIGGEPLILKWIPEFVHIAIKSGMSVNISTNGFSAEMTRKFTDLDPGKFNIGISLEGSTEAIHNRLTNAHNFHRAVATISELVSSGMDPIVKTVVDRETKTDIPAIVVLVRKLGVKRYGLIHMDMMSRDTTLKNAALAYCDFRDLYEIISNTNGDMTIFKVNASCFEKQTIPEGVLCAGGVRKLSVMPDGSVYPCNLFQHIQEFNLGNIFEGELLSIWRSPKLDLFRNSEQNRCTIDSCPNWHSCTGGCPAHGYYHYGRHIRHDIRCSNNSISI